MPRAEILGDCDELFFDLGLTERKRTSENVDDARCVSRDEWADEHAGAIGPESDARRMDGQAAHIGRIAGCTPSACVSSASER